MAREQQWKEKRSGNARPFRGTYLRRGVEVRPGIAVRASPDRIELIGVARDAHVLGACEPSRAQQDAERSARREEKDDEGSRRREEIL